MVEFSAHLDELIGHVKPQAARADSSTSLQEHILNWIPGPEGLDDVLPELESIDESFDDHDLSILNLPWFLEEVGDISIASSNPLDTLYNRLRSNPDISSLLPTLSKILSSSSSKSEDEISAEVLELLGFHQIELVMEIMDNRIPLSYKLAIVDSETPAEKPKPMLKKGRDKPKEREITGGIGFPVPDAKRRMEDAFREAAARPLFSGTNVQATEIPPHVYTSSSTVQGSVLSSTGSKYMLPIGTTREDREEYEEVTIPPAKAVPPRSNERLVRVTDLDGLAKGAFSGYKTLNRIQSLVYPSAYGTNENVLLQPALVKQMLTILRVIDQHLSSSSAKSTPTQLSASIKRDEFKIIYVAPMKARAAEIVRKLGKRLAWLSVRVRELTGDMQLTKAEIPETQIIITTPEKWDVVTPKPTGEGELASVSRSDSICSTKNVVL